MPIRAQFDRFTIDSESRQLVGDGIAIHLSPKAFDLLCLLITARPNAVAKDELHAHIWPGIFVVDANLSVLVAEIRRALGDAAHVPKFIRTVHRHGYAFCAEATDLRPGIAGRTGESAPKAWLVWRERVLLLAEGENVIGRDPGCSVWLDVPGVSRRHARVVVSGDVVVVEDLGSKNGTFVADTPVLGPRPLHDGEMLQIGPVEVQFRLWLDGNAKGTVPITRRNSPSTHLDS
ncbi:MAG: FHA domain-containing protein [Vicinamibacterales bacterium]